MPVSYPPFPKREFRCTRPNRYTSPTCSGYDNISARQGHYVIADGEAKAAIEMFDAFPNDDLIDVAEKGSAEITRWMRDEGRAVLLHEWTSKGGE